MRKKGAVGILLLFALFFGPLGVSGEDGVKDVFLFVGEREVLGFSALGNRWVALNLRSEETALEKEYGGRVAVVVTNFRVLGFSALTARWAEENLKVGESMVTLEAEGNVGAVVTTLRAFGFSAKTGSWTVRRFPLK